MRAQPSLLHVDIDAFFAAVEQRDKPSLRGRPVVVGGVGSRGVVATASYEARAFGVGSAMATAVARSLCPHAAFLAPRAAVYQVASRQFLAVLREFSQTLEPLSPDEAFLDLEDGAAPASISAGTSPTSTSPSGTWPSSTSPSSTSPSSTSPSGASRTGGSTRGRPADSWSVEAVEQSARAIQASILARTGLTCSIGAATGKSVAKVASERRKPSGLVIVEPGLERRFLGPLPVRSLFGVGPVTAQRLNRHGIATIGALAAAPEEELVTLLGSAARELARLARGVDDRPVLAHRPSKSCSVEATFDEDVADRRALTRVIDSMATAVCRRLAAGHRSGRTVTVKLRRSDFTTITRATTLPGPTDEPVVVARAAQRLIDTMEVGSGVRLLGVAMSGLADWVQEGLLDRSPSPAGPPAPLSPIRQTDHPRWQPGQDVIHERHGRGWVWGQGHGMVTVRFETADTPSGPVRTMPCDDSALQAWYPAAAADEEPDLIALDAPAPASSRSIAAQPPPNAQLEAAAPVWPAGSPEEAGPSG